MDINRGPITPRTQIPAETDPIFVASPAHGIASSDIIAWNGAVSLEHARQHALDATADHTIGSLTSGYLIKSDGSKLVPATNTDVQVAAAVSANHAAVTLGVSNDPQLALAAQELTLNKKVRRIWFGA